MKTNFASICVFFIMESQYLLTSIDTDIFTKLEFGSFSYYLKILVDLKQRKQYAMVLFFVSDWDNLNNIIVEILKEA